MDTQSFRWFLGTLALIALAVLVLAACGRSGPLRFGTIPPPRFDPLNFELGVNNPWFPLPPGTQLSYRKDGPMGSEEILVHVLPETRIVAGVACIVVHETNRLEGDLIEEGFGWYAQDRDGIVWHLGEETRTFENGRLVSLEGSWEAGHDGARPGIVMPAAPKVGDTFALEYYAGVAEDRLTIRALGVEVVVPFGTLPSCVQTDEFTRLEPGVLEAKYYAPGLGLVLEVDEDGVRTELVAVTVD